MPIRTHRGRAAVYRRLWGWPLRSPKHLVAALVVLAIAATGIGVLLPEPPPVNPERSAQSTAGQRPAPDRESAPTTASPPSISVPRNEPPPVPPDPAGLAAAEAWGKEWVNHPPGTRKQQWLDRLRPYTTDEFLPEMESVALANVPTAVTGPPTPMGSTAKTMTVRLPTDLGDIKITAINTPQGWRIGNYDKAV